MVRDRPDETFGTLFPSLFARRGAAFAISASGRRGGVHDGARRRDDVFGLDDRLWLASFITYDLGYFDEHTCRLEPIENPFGKNVLPMSPE